jgi:hypothetical protein
MKRNEKKLVYYRMTVGNSANSFHEFENIRSEALEKIKLNELKPQKCYINNTS